MMPIYSIDVKIYGTAYIRAKDEAEALKAAQALNNLGLELSEDESQEVPISGRRFDDPDLPDASLSPAMTIHGPDAGQMPELAED